MKSSVPESVAKIVTAYVNKGYPTRGLVALAMVLTALVVAVVFVSDHGLRLLGL